MKWNSQLRIDIINWGLIWSKVHFKWATLVAEWRTLCKEPEAETETSAGRQLKLPRWKMMVAQPRVEATEVGRSAWVTCSLVLAISDWQNHSYFTLKRIWMQTPRVRKSQATLASVVGASSSKLKGHRLDSQSGHMPGLQVLSLVGACSGTFLSHDVCLSVSLPLSLSLPFPLSLE